MMVPTLPLSLQYLIQLDHVIKEREVKISSKSPCIHLVETTPSVLSTMPWAVFREHTVSLQGS